MVFFINIMDLFSSPFTCPHPWKIFQCYKRPLYLCFVVSQAASDAVADAAAVGDDDVDAGIAASDAQAAREAGPLMHRY